MDNERWCLVCCRWLNLSRGDHRSIYWTDIGWGLRSEGLELRNDIFFFLEGMYNIDLTDPIWRHFMASLQYFSMGSHIKWEGERVCKAPIYFLRPKFEGMRVLRYCDDRLRSCQIIISWSPLDCLKRNIEKCGSGGALGLVGRLQATRTTRTWPLRRA